MEKIARSLTELVGNTPLLELVRFAQEQGLSGRLIAKLEYFNPLGSVKDRVALAMINDAEAKGRLRPGGLIIEPTSGNTGVGLAFVAAARGYRIILTMPETMSAERRSLLRALGAEIVLTPGAEGMKGAIARAEAIRAQNPGSVILQQFENPANPAAHRRTTALEIWRDTAGQVDVFVAGVGTGGTVSGVGEVLKERNPAVEVVAVEPASCPSMMRGKYVYDFCDTGKTTPLARMYTLGSGFMPSPNHAGGLRYHGMSPIVSKLYHDGYMRAVSVEQTEVFKAAEMFAKVEGTLPAPESAHAIKVAIDEALKCKKTGEKKVILFGLTGTGYFDMTAYGAYNDGAMSDYIPTEADLERGFASFPDIPQNKNC